MGKSYKCSRHYELLAVRNHYFCICQWEIIFIVYVFFMYIIVLFFLISVLFVDIFLFILRANTALIVFKGGRSEL